MNEEKLKDQVSSYLISSSEVKKRAAVEISDSIASAAKMVISCYKNGGKLLICGNGGSAADSQHIAAEFVSILRPEFPRAALPAIALTTDTSIMTARGNDYGFEEVFSRQLEALGISNDILIGISTSGNSANVVSAVVKANQLKVKTISLTGDSGGRLKENSDLTICVPSKSTQHVQETHIAIAHIICQLVEEELFPNSKNDF